MSYTPPTYNAVTASWVGASAYAPPAHNAVAASWAASSPVAQISAPGPLGAPALLGASGEVPDGAIVVGSPLGASAALGAVVVLGRLAVASPLGVPAALGQIVVAGTVAVPSPLAPSAVVGTVIRYELRGEVRDQGVLVNRRVRAHRRSDGALIAEGDTVGGRFALPVGFAADEFYIVPIHMEASAADFSPPCANRVASVLAMDPV